MADLSAAERPRSPAPSETREHPRSGCVRWSALLERIHSHSRECLNEHLLEVRWRDNKKC
jgi:hypothetical protein